MRIISNITNMLRNKSVTQLAAKAAGLAGLGMVGYDSHYIGKIQADLYASEQDARATSFYTNNAMYTTNMSKIQSGIKEASLQMQLNQGWRRFINLGIGYTKGFIGMLTEHVVPLGLGIGALFTKGKISKGFAAGLGIYALYEVLRNSFGWGVPGGPIK